MGSRAQSPRYRPLNDIPDETLTPDEPTKKKREATVYDAVAGRISARGFITDKPVISSGRDTASSSTAAVAPESVLFRRKNAPVRYEEDDLYFANERLPAGALPDSDLLKALHCYTSDFYARVVGTAGKGTDWRSMDETALLALGILMEEMCRDDLGETGDLVFTEGEAIEPQGIPSGWERAGSVVQRSEAAIRSGETRSRKKRRIHVRSSNAE